MSWSHFDMYYSDPPVDESVTLRCVNPECWMYEEYEEQPHRWANDGTWHPETFKEYQGEHPHGGYVDHYTLDAHDCPECGHDGEEV